MSQTQYIFRLNIAVPESLMDAANNLAVAIGEMAGDADTFARTTHADGSGSKFCCIQWVCSAQLFEFLAGILRQRDFAQPSWSLAKALQAQLAVILWLGPSTLRPTIPQVQAGKIICAIGEDAQGTFQQMGLTRLPEDINVFVAVT